MAQRHDHTGHLMQTKGFSKEYDAGFSAVDKTVTMANTPSPVFKIYHCDACHIKVSSSNGKCPGCGKDLE